MWTGETAAQGGLSSCIATHGTFAAETSATPLPAALPLFVSGLGALGFFARRRKRKAALAA
jgi:PEP-CTERM motif-containing protein